MRMGSVKIMMMVTWFVGVQTGLEQRFTCADTEGMEESADFNPKNANSVSMALVSLARNMKVEGRRLRQLAKQFDAQFAAIAAREDKAAKLEYDSLVENESLSHPFLERHAACPAAGRRLRCSRSVFNRQSGCGRN